MLKYVLRRLLLGVPVLIGISILIFAAIRIIPGDPTAIQNDAGGYVFTQEQRDRLREQMGIDRPLTEQYLDWVGDIVTGDLGSSFIADTPVTEIVGNRGPVSAQIAIMAILLAWLIGIPLGIFGAVRQNQTSDYASRFIAVFLLAVPGFWMGLLIILFTVLVLGWRPPLVYVHLWSDPIENLQMTVGPAFVMGVGLGAVFARITRSSVLDVLSSDFVRTAQAKGLNSRSVLVAHVLRNALLPVLTISGLALGGLIGGAVAVERAFSVPGLGLSLVEGIQSADWTLIQSLVFLYALSFILANILIDIAYGFVDPRIRVA